MKLYTLCLLLLLTISCGRNSRQETSRAVDQITYVTRIGQYGCTYRIPVNTPWGIRYVVNNNVCRTSFVGGRYYWVYRNRI